MKANEFVKAMGLDAVKGFIKNGNIRTPETELELKRLVESHELVEKHQGLNGARNVLKLLEESLDIGLYHGIDGVDATTEVPKIKQAIADVESCEVEND